MSPPVSHAIGAGPVQQMFVSVTNLGLTTLAINQAFAADNTINGILLSGASPTAAAVAALVALGKIRTNPNKTSDNAVQLGAFDSNDDIKYTTLSALPLPSRFTA